jgi:hypothetical protein
MGFPIALAGVAGGEIGFGLRTWIANCRDFERDNWLNGVAATIFTVN